MNLEKEFINILACPKKLCRGDLEEINNGEKFFLKCLNCGEKYPVISGIPILYPNLEHSQEAHKRHWDLIDNAKSYAKKYDSYLKKEGVPWGLYTHLSELKAIQKLTKGIDLSGKTIIDCGCGNGRLLSVYKEAEKKIGIDTSFILLEQTKKREPDFWLVCGQLEDMPFKDAVADFSISIRVFQHLQSPEQAFSEMVRATKPSGYVALELYNKFNPKELYKRIRMIKWMNKRWPWGLNYDRYYSYREIEYWYRNNFVKILKYAGAGWGIHFYLLEILQFRRFAPKRLQKIVYDFFLKLEDIAGDWPFISKTLEKVCVVGSIQSGPRKEKILEKIIHRYRIKKEEKRAKDFQKKLDNRNYALTGNDDQHLRLTVNWLKKAQDATADGGVSRGFGLVYNGKGNNFGWQPSYPETTGYIIPTMIAAGEELNDYDLIRRAKLMADWEIAIMHPDGAVHGGNVSVKPNKAVFDTGQVIRGLLAIYNKTNEEKYLSASIKSADWILNSEHKKEGRWTESNASCVDGSRTTYNIYAVAPIVQLGTRIGNEEYKELGRRTARLTIEMQNQGGWFSNADFKQGDDALLHTIAYTIDGLWDIGELLNEGQYLDAARNGLDGVLLQMNDQGYIPGRLNSKWQGTVEWSCLTGIAQIGVTAMKVYKRIGDEKYLKAVRKMKEFLKICQNNIDENYGGGKGALWGSWPISGDYGKYEALSWAAKYFADLLLEFISLKNN